MSKSTQKIQVWIFSFLLISATLCRAETLTGTNQIILEALLYVTNDELIDKTETNKLNFIFYEAPKEVVTLLKTALTNQNARIVTDLKSLNADAPGKHALKENVKKFGCTVISLNGMTARASVQISRHVDNRRLYEVELEKRESKWVVTKCSLVRIT
jgi:hypothetical protein